MNDSSRDRKANQKNQPTQPDLLDTYRYLSKMSPEVLDTERLTNIDKPLLKNDLYTSRGYEDRDMMSPEFKAYMDHRAPLTNLEQNTNYLHQDTPGFKVFTRDKSNELANLTEKDNSLYLMQVKNDLITDFNSTLNQICSINPSDKMSKSYSSRLTKMKNSTPLMLHRIQGLENNYISSNASLFSNKENFLAGKENFHGNSVKSELSNFKTSVTTETSKDIEREGKHFHNETSSSRRSGIYSSNQYRGILDPSLKNAGMSTPRDEIDQKGSNRFTSLVSDIQIEDGLFSLGTKPSN